MNNEKISESNVKCFIQIAVQKHQSGEFDEAESLYKQILQLELELENEYHPIASSNLGSIFEQQGKLDAALECYQQALRANPNYAEAHYNLGNVRKKQGKLQAASDSYQQALKIQPEIAEAHNNLGTVFQKQGKLEAAVQSYQQALKIKPEYAQAHYNLGNLFLKQGKLDEALKSYDQALKIKPDYPQAYDNLGNIFLQKGKLEAAVESYQQALKIKPNFPSAHHNLGNALKLQGKLEAAINSYRQAISLEPNYAEVYHNLGNTLYEQGNLEAAIKSYHQALEYQPEFAPPKFGIVIGQLPIIYSSLTQINLNRNNYQQQLENLAKNYKQSTPKKQQLMADAVGSLQPFYLAYQGLNDRDLQQTYGEMIVQMMSSRYPQWSQPIALPQLEKSEKIRIGFVSRFFYNHSNWKIPIKGWVENLNRSEFELFGYYTDTTRDRETVRAAKVFDKFTQGPLQLEQWCELIQKDKLHILIFPEFGMDPITVQLGCLRLAPIQMTSWGHPETSGLPTIDYYLSSDLMEPENAPEHYTEKLVRLPNLSIHYTPLAIEIQEVNKEEISIKNDETMFWCCQSLFKYLPQHDDVFPRIASDLGSCKFVFVQYNKGEYVTEVFQERLSSAFQKLGLNYQDYCIFLAPMNTVTFASRSAIADVFLDSIGWSGCNSTLEALAHNIPVVTLPGDLMRGRHSMAILKMMGIEETIAQTKDEYVQMAVRLGQDAEYRQQIKKQVAENKYKLYRDFKPVRALEDFILNAVGKSKSKKSGSDNVLESDVQLLLDKAVNKYQLNKFYEAESLYKQVLEIQPNHVLAQVSLAELLQAQRRFDEAIVAYQKVLNIKPNPLITTLALNNLGNILKEQGKLEAAVESYQQALQIDPNHASFYYNLGTTFCEQGKFEAGVDIYLQGLKIQPDFAPAKFGICMSQLRVIYCSVDEIQLRRNNYQQHLQDLAQSYQRSNYVEQDPKDAVGSAQPFYLAYQGLNDRDLQQTYGEMIVHLMSSRYPQWSQPIALPQLEKSEKIRIGFVSRFFYNHSNWKIPIKGWVENLDKSEFELFGYHTDTTRDKETVTATKVFDKFTQGPLQLEQWCELIQKDKLHILIFPEFGMDPITVQLGCLRLAPIQMTSWGHPETSGLPTIDYYLSSELMEPENAQEHYTEQLVKLPNLGIHYTPLAIEPQATSKGKLGIAPNEIMFWCCQSLYKYLPQHDDVFPRIAKDLPKCKFVFLEAPQGEYVTEIFRQRLRRVFEEFGLNSQHYCIFSPRLDTKKFASTTAIADVFLDSIGWSGCNSTLEAIAHNIPVLTLPGDLMRGLHTMAILKMMGIEETIAETKEDYVKIAIRLGIDAQYRQYLSGQIAENKYKLYGDLKPVRAMEDFLFKVVNKPRRFNAQEVVETLQLAVQSHRANRLNEAQQLYHQVLEKQPDHPEALYSLGMLAAQLGQPQTAEELLTAATLVQPDSIKTWFSLGNLRLGQEQYSSSARAYRRALALRPDSLPIYNNLGYALQQQGLFDEAVKCYQKALELKPDFIEAEANLGNALQQQGKLSSEKQLYYAQLNHKLGVARKKAGDLKTAAAYYRQWLKLSNPHYAQAVEANSESKVTPPIPQTEVTVGAYQFPAIPPVSDGETRPFWSVVITVYNRTDYLLECLTSVLAEWTGFEQMEILVIDDASTSPIFELVNAIGGGVVRYYRNEQNLGLPGNWNAGVALSRGQWIHLLHDDDYILPGFYSRLQEGIEGSSDSVGAAFTGYENINDKEQVTASKQVYGEYRGIAPEDWLQRIGVVNLLNMAAVVIRRDVHEQLGSYYPELKYTPDWELYKRIAAAYDWWCEPGILARYREHKSNATTNVLLAGNHGKEIFHAIEISKSYLPANDCATITAKARSYYWNYFLDMAAIAIRTGNNVAAAYRMIQEALIFDRSSVAVAKLFAWLTQDELSLLRDEIASRLISLSLNDRVVATAKV
jgi:protein O-GlcNAc transferase